MAPNRKIFALKRIKLQGKDSEASKGFVDEITLLQRLRGKQNIIQLVDAEVCVHPGSADTAIIKTLTAQLTGLGQCVICQFMQFTQQRLHLCCLLVLGVHNLTLISSQMKSALALNPSCAAYIALAVCVQHLTVTNSQSQMHMHTPKLTVNKIECQTAVRACSHACLLELAKTHVVKQE